MNKEKIRYLRFLADSDKIYKKIKERYKLQEEAFSQAAALLPHEQQDILWAFICTSDELDHRLLEIACDYIRFD